MQDVIDRLSYLSGINYTEEQLKILCYDKGAMRILACAGSGKTTTLTHLIAKKILCNEIRDTQKILCTTFSRAGSGEMEDRISSLLGMFGDYKINVQTMHATYYKVLRSFGLSRTVCTNYQREHMVKTACEKAKVKGLDDEEIQIIDSLISYQVNNLMSDKELCNSYVFSMVNITPEQYVNIRRNYSALKDKSKLIDFDDMQLYMYKLLCIDRDKAVLDFCRSRWEYFFIDEFQDTSKIQFAILRELVGDGRNLVVIGDDDQCIYQWRGADPSILLNITAYYEMKDFVLSTNYRCKNNIVNFGFNVITKNKIRYDKSMVSYDSGGKVKITLLEGFVDAGDSVFKQSMMVFNHIKDCLKKGLYRPSEIAVLARNNSHLTILQNMLMREGIPCEFTLLMRVTSLPFYKVMRNAVFMAKYPDDIKIVGSVLWSLIRYLKSVDAEKIIGVMEETKFTLKDILRIILEIRDRNTEEVPFINVCKSKKLCKMAYDVLSELDSGNTDDIDELYCNLRDPDPIQRARVLVNKVSLRLANTYKNTEDRARISISLGEYFDYLLKEAKNLDDVIAFLRLTEQYESTIVSSGTDDRIILSTIHGAKGLEWKHVILFLVDCVSFPSASGMIKMAGMRVSANELFQRLDEERRLFYVGVTRAKEDLWIIADFCRASLFILEGFSKENADLQEYFIRAILGRNKYYAEKICADYFDSTLKNVGLEAVNREKELFSITRDIRDNKKGYSNEESFVEHSNFESLPGDSFKEFVDELEAKHLDNYTENLKLIEVEI